MNDNNKDLSESYKIIRQFIKCHAGEGDAVSAQNAINTITGIEMVELATGEDKESYSSYSKRKY